MDGCVDGWMAGRLKALRHNISSKSDSFEREY